MIELVMYTEKNDTVFHTEKTVMLRLVVEINVGGMTADVIDKVTCSFDDLQLEQVDLKCVHALNEPHLHDIRIVPNKHEVDQQMDFRSFMVEGINVEFHFKPEVGIGDGEGIYTSNRSVNNEVSVIDANPLNFAPPSNVNSALPSNVAKNIEDSSDASLEKDIVDEAERLRRSSKLTCKRKQIAEPSVKEARHKL
nr:hypothetical protein [Tanacetum cinerariifolium]